MLKLTLYLQDIDFVALFEYISIDIVIRVNSQPLHLLILGLLLNTAISWIINHLASPFHCLLQSAQSLLRVLADLLDLIPTNKALLGVHVLPIDEAISEDLHALLVVGERWILLGHLLYHPTQVLVLRHVTGKHGTSLGQLQCQLYQLVTEFPEHRVLAEHFIQVVQHLLYSLLLVTIFDVNQS